MKPYHKIYSIYKRDEKGKIREREYSCPEFEYLSNLDWVWTEKIDGTNIRVMWDGEGQKVKFGGRTDNAEINMKLIEKLGEVFTQEKLEKVFRNTPVCLYGEGFGPKIQKGGGNYGKEMDFIVFDIFIDRWWLKREDIEGIAASLEIKIVPMVGKGSLSCMVNKVKEGLTSTFGDFLAEGIVAKPEIELFTRDGERIITKIKGKDF